MIIYVLVNVGLIAVLPLQEIAKSVLPAADAAQLIFGGSGARLSLQSFQLYRYSEF